MRKSTVLMFSMFLFFVFNTSSAVTGYQGILLNPVKSIKSYQLKDHTGNAIQFPQATGKYQLVFFGYTNCPDICPMTLQKIKHVIGRLKNASEIDFYFISIDSERDGPEHLQSFLNFFNPDIKGLTGSIHNIKKVEKEFGILTRKFQGKSAFAYKLEHSVFMYLLNGDGKLMLMYPGSTTPTQLVSDLTTLLASKEM